MYFSELGFGKCGRQLRGCPAPCSIWVIGTRRGRRRWGMSGTEKEDVTHAVSGPNPPGPSAYSLLIGPWIATDNSNICFPIYLNGTNSLCCVC